MAYGAPPFQNKPSLDEISRALETMSKRFPGENKKVGMTKNGRLVTPADGKRDVFGNVHFSETDEYFGNCEEHLHDYLQSRHQQKQLRDRQVAILEPQEHPTLEHTRRLVRQLQSATAPSQPQRPQQSASQPTAHELTSQVEQLVGNFDGSPEQTRQVLAVLSQLERLQPGSTASVLGFLKKKPLNRESKAMIDRFLTSSPASVATPESPAPRQLRPVNTLIKAMRLDPGQLREFQVSTPEQGYNLQSRKTDRYQQDFPDKGSKVLRDLLVNPIISGGMLKNLEYRVVDDFLDVNRRVWQANERAEQQGLAQNPQVRRYRKFNTNTALGDRAFMQVEDSGSEASASLRGAGIAYGKGKREAMEDTYIIDRFEFISAGYRIPVAIAGVFDGHGGSQASRAVARQITHKLRSRLEMYNRSELTEAGIWNALKLAMVDLDRMESFYSNGTTACVGLRIQDRLWVVNVGDSRAMLAFPGGHYQQISEDAKPDIPEYANAVQKRGGIPNHGTATGPRQAGWLRVARSIGDHIHSGALSARGKVTSYPVQDVARAQLVIGSDGIFGVATSGQVASLVDQLRRQNPAITQEQLARELVSHSYAAGSEDNLTALVVPVTAMV